MSVANDPPAGGSFRGRRGNSNLVRIREEGLALPSIWTAESAAGDSPDRSAIVAAIGVTRCL